MDLTFKKATTVENLVFELRLADFPRAVNRAKINDTFNGLPPYTAEEVSQNNITFNVNFLEPTTIAHNARRQFYTGLLAPDPLFTVDVDYGPVYRRREWGNRITKELGKIIRESLRYRECQRSVFALDTLHGIGPSTWEDKQGWTTRALGVEDVLIPSGTYLDMTNLPFFSVYRQYTGMELLKKISGPNVDPAWNQSLADQAIRWVDDEAVKLMGSSWPEVWSPEKWSERMKEDSGLYSSDKCPTIDCFDFYYWSDEKKNSGWRRRIVLDAWGTPGMGGAGVISYKRKFEHGKGEFLYDSGDRKYADTLGQIIHFQFADGSSVAPFRYHSVRSLGFLLYAVCNLQNRFRCKFSESAWEAMMQYLRSNNPEDAERALAINLVDKRVIPQGVEFVREEERWKVDAGLVEAILQLNRQTMSDNSSSFTQDFDWAEESKKDETATRTMAKVNSTAALVGAMLQQAYDYQSYQYREICRRFCIKNSSDPDVKKFRVRCLKEGVPEEALNVEMWNIQPQKVIGSGNKTVQVGMMNQVMSQYDRLNPEAQQECLRLWLAVNTDDYDLAQRWVPDQPHISDTVHDAQVSVGTIMAGGTVAPKPGFNVVETIETWLHAMAQIAAKVEQNGGMATPEELAGLQNFGQHIAQRIQQLAMDKTQKQKVKIYSDDLGKLMNLVKAYAQRLAESKQQQNGNGQMDPKDAAKVQATMLTAQTKAQIAQQKHAQSTAQKQIAFEQKVRQQSIEHKQKLAATDLQAASAIHRNRMKSLE